MQRRDVSPFHGQATGRVLPGGKVQGLVDFDHPSGPGSDYAMAQKLLNQFIAEGPGKKILNFNLAISSKGCKKTTYIFKKKVLLVTINSLAVNLPIE